MGHSDETTPKTLVQTPDTIRGAVIIIGQTMDIREAKGSKRPGFLWLKDLL
jgi:hypothetical protein